MTSPHPRDNHGTSSEDFLARLRATGLVAIIRTQEPGLAEPIGRVLVDHGVELLEVALTTPDACPAITALRAYVAARRASALVGAGTVLTSGDVDAVMAAGADFVVTPAVAESVAIAARQGIPVAAGAYTATEAVQAVAQGACVVKLFPAAAAGPSYLKALRDPLPHIPFVAVGGIGLDQVEPFRQAGAVGFGVGSPLVGDAARGGSLDELAARAEQFVAACRADDRADQTDRAAR